MARETTLRRGLMRTTPRTPLVKTASRIMGRGGVDHLGDRDGRAIEPMLARLVGHGPGPGTWRGRLPVRSEAGRHPGLLLFSSVMGLWRSRSTGSRTSCSSRFSWRREALHRSTSRRAGLWAAGRGGDLVVVGRGLGRAARLRVAVRPRLFADPPAHALRTEAATTSLPPRTAPAGRFGPGG
jgi:hypothetical protein